LETTTFHYYFDADRDGHGDIVCLFDAIGAEKYEGYTSEYTIFELQDAQEPKRSRMLALIEKYNIIVLGITKESDRVADIYIRERIIPAKFRDDSAQVAIASVNGLDGIVSYNFRHINRSKTKMLVERVNHAEGYKGIVICTSKEVLDYDDESV
jgi:hypothetical protein